MDGLGDSRSLGMEVVIRFETMVILSGIERWTISHGRTQRTCTLLEKKKKKVLHKTNVTWNPKETVTSVLSIFYLLRNLVKRPKITVDSF